MGEQNYNSLARYSNLAPSVCVSDTAYSIQKSAKYISIPIPYCQQQPENLGVNKQPDKKPHQEHNILKPISIFLILKSLLGPSVESIPIQHATNRWIHWEIANSSSGAQISKVAETANLQNLGLIQCQSRWFTDSGQPWRCYSINYRTDTIVYIIMTVINTEVYCIHVTFQRYLPKWLKFKRFCV